MQRAAATPGVPQPLGLGLQRAGQALKTQKTPLIFSKACSIVLMGPGQARLEREMTTWGFHWVVLELEPLFLLEIQEHRC